MIISMLEIFLLEKNSDAHWQALMRNLLLVLECTTLIFLYSDFVHLDVYLKE